jgi:hypothetical protein
MTDKQELVGAETELTVVVKEKQSDTIEICDWCATRHDRDFVEKRGATVADYRLENTHGAFMGYLCDLCAEIIVMVPRKS